MIWEFQCDFRGDWSVNFSGFKLASEIFLYILVSK